MVDGGSTDRHPRDRRGVRGGRRPGARSSTTRAASRPPRSTRPSTRHALGWLVRIDAHATIPPDYVEQVVPHLRSGRLGRRRRPQGRRRPHRRRAGPSPRSWARSSASATRCTTTAPSRRRSTTSRSAPTRATSSRRSAAGTRSIPVNEDFEFDYRRPPGRPRAAVRSRALASTGSAARSVPRRSGASTAATAGARRRTSASHPESAALRHLAAPTMVAGAGRPPRVLLPFANPRWALALVAPVRSGSWRLGTVTDRGPGDGHAGRRRGSPRRSWPCTSGGASVSGRAWPVAVAHRGGEAGRDSPASRP